MGWWGACARTRTRPLCAQSRRNTSRSRVPASCPAMYFRTFALKNPGCLFYLEDEGRLKMNLARENKKYVHTHAYRVRIVASGRLTGYNIIYAIEFESRTYRMSQFLRVYRVHLHDRRRKEGRCVAELAQRSVIVL